MSTDLYHAGRPGEPIQPRDGRSRWAQRPPDECHGEVRTIYAREDKKWLRIGWTCLRCGTIELEAAVLPDDSKSSYYYGAASRRPRRPGAVLAPVSPAPVDTAAAGTGPVLRPGQVVPANGTYAPSYRRPPKPMPPVALEAGKRFPPGPSGWQLVAAAAVDTPRSRAVDTGAGVDVDTDDRPPSADDQTWTESEERYARGDR